MNENLDRLALEVQDLRPKLAQAEQQRDDEKTLRIKAIDRLDEVLTRAEQAEQRVAGVAAILHRPGEPDADITEAVQGLTERVAQLESVVEDAKRVVGRCEGAVGNLKGMKRDFDTHNALSDDIRDTRMRLENVLLTRPQPAPCGVRGCTLPQTHGDEPHSWENATHDAPQPGHIHVEAPWRRGTCGSCGFEFPAPKEQG